MAFVYLIRCNEFVKIGIAQNTETRLMELQTGNPYPLTLLDRFEFANAMRVEKALHVRYSDKRVQGEWFSLDDADVNEIRDICQHYDEYGAPIAETISKEFAAEILRSALSYCVEAGLNVQISNHEGSLFVVIDGLGYFEKEHTIRPLTAEETVGNA